ncbi:MAG: hypothetical protein KatS3mg087_0593 [Patescibacteria group bacterium]|nr:MAG: hypothetical protein KatS3mg087_0593 [Patescibacteria group bacterium]
MEVSKNFGNFFVEFSAENYGEVEFRVNGDLERQTSQGERFPHVCRWLIKQFNQCHDETLWAVACECDSDDSARKKAYEKFLPLSMEVEGVTVYYRGDAEEVKKHFIWRYC